MNKVHVINDLSENLRAIAEKVDPTQMSVVVKKHDIVSMTQNRGVTRGTLNITMKKIKRCRREDVVTTRVRISMIFAQMT